MEEPKTIRKHKIEAEESILRILEHLEEVTETEADDVYLERTLGEKSITIVLKIR